jgi:hypothetical protein
MANTKSPTSKKKAVKARKPAKSPARSTSTAFHISEKELTRLLNTVVKRYTGATLERRQLVTGTKSV